MSEIELKLQIPKQKKNQIVKALQAFKPEHISLQAQYFDTPSFELAQNHTAIRLRKEGSEWIQTLKSAHHKDAIQRYELEINRGEFESAPALCFKAYKKDKQAKKILNTLLDHPDQLVLQFETKVERTFKVVQHNTSHIEICLDLGQVGRNDQQEDICEVEFELKSGTVTDLLEFVQLWVENYAIWLDVRSKAERGHLISQQQKVSAAPQISHIKITKKLAKHPILATLITQYIQPALPCVAAIADQVAEYSHYQVAESTLSHLLQVLTLSDSLAEKFTALKITQLQSIKQQLTEYICLLELQQNVSPYTNESFKGLTSTLARLQTQLAQTMMSKETTLLLLSLLDLSQDHTKYSEFTGADFLQQLEQQYINVSTTLSEKDFNQVHISSHEFEIYTHYLKLKKDATSKSISALIALQQTQQLQALIDSVSMLKTDQNFFTGWLAQQLAIQQHAYKKRLNKM